MPAGSDTRLRSLWRNAIGSRGFARFGNDPRGAPRGSYLENPQAILGHWNSHLAHFEYPTSSSGSAMPYLEQGKV
jgi:hypothetical protein